MDKIRLVISESSGMYWKKWLREFGGNIYHGEEWADIRRGRNSLPLFFHWLDQDERCVGIAVGIKSWSPVRYIGCFFKRLDFDTYPASLETNADLTRCMLSQLVEYSKKSGYMNLSILSYNTRACVPGLEQLGLSIMPRMEFILDLSMTEDELWKNLSSHHRRKIKNATKQGLVFEEESTLDAVRKFRTLQKLSRDRRIQRGESIGMLEDAYFEELGGRYLEKNLGHIFFLTHHQKPVSGAFVSIYGDQAIYVYGGSSDDGFRMDAPALLFWKIFSWCREFGCREFSMGGVPASAVDTDSQSHGLYRFKAGFGGEQVMCFSGIAENLNSRRAWIKRGAKKISRFFLEGRQ